MSGARLGRGRSGRFAVYGVCVVAVLFFVFLYRAITTEMTRLREMDVECSHHKEALSAQLQVIFEYKVRLEKSLVEEKRSSAALRQKLQQRTSLEKSLRDKDSSEAMRRFNSLQQTHKILQSENQDLKEQCEKQQKEILEDRKRLESTLALLRSQLRESGQDKEKKLEQLKTQYKMLDTEKTKLEEQYKTLLKSNEYTANTLEDLRKENIHLARELQESEDRCKATSPVTLSKKKRDNEVEDESLVNSVQTVPASRISVSSTVAQQQVSRASDDVAAIPQPLQAPRNHQPISYAEKRNVQLNNASRSDLKSVKHNVSTTLAGSDDIKQVHKKNASSLGKPISTEKLSTSTKSGIKMTSTVPNKPVISSVSAKPIIKAKVPQGVLPILQIIETNKNLEETKNLEIDKSSAIKNSPNDENKNRGKLANDPIPQLNGPEDAEWFRVKGIQEIGDDLGNDARIQDFDDGRIKAGLNGADYDNYYNKGPQQKNLEESEDEGEEEDGDYMNNDVNKKQE